MEMIQIHIHKLNFYANDIIQFLGTPQHMSSLHAHNMAANITFLPDALYSYTEETLIIDQYVKNVDN